MLSYISKSILLTLDNMHAAYLFKHPGVGQAAIQTYPLPVFEVI